MLKRLNEAATRRAQEKGGELWYGTDLALALNWRDEQQPTEAWAGRYLNVSPHPNPLPGRGDQEEVLPLPAGEREESETVFQRGTKKTPSPSRGRGGVGVRGVDTNSPWASWPRARPNNSASSRPRKTAASGS